MWSTIFGWHVLAFPYFPSLGDEGLEQSQTNNSRQLSFVNNQFAHNHPPITLAVMFSISNSFLSLMASSWNLLSLCSFLGTSSSETGFSAPLFWLPVPKNLPRPDCTLCELGGEDWGLPVESFWGVDSALPPLTLSCFFTLVEYNVDATHQQNVLKPNFKTAENLQ